MNGYTIMADSYRKAMEQGQIEKECSCSLGSSRTVLVTLAEKPLFKRFLCVFHSFKGTVLGFTSPKTNTEPYFSDEGWL